MRSFRRRWRGSDTSCSAVTCRTDALGQSSPHRAVDNPAHRGWADLFRSRKFTNGLFVEKNQGRKGGELRRPDARLSVFCPDKAENPSGSGMQGIGCSDS